MQTKMHFKVLLETIGKKRDKGETLKLLKVNNKNKNRYKKQMKINANKI